LAHFCYNGFYRPVVTVNAPLSKAVRTVDALRDKQEAAA
jgi:hypothetical protein